MDQLIDILDINSTPLKHRLITISGSIGAGKTYSLIEFVSKAQIYYDSIILISPCVLFDPKYKYLVSKTFNPKYYKKYVIHKNFDPLIIKTLCDYQVKHANHEIHKHQRNFLLVIDDLTGQVKKMSDNTAELNSLIFTLRHLNITCIFAVHAINALHPAIRKQCTCLILKSTSTYSELRWIYEEYCFTYFNNDFKSFCQVFKNVTQEYGSLIVVINKGMLKIFNKDMQLL